MNIHLKETLPFQLCKIHRAAIKITKYPEGKGRRMSGRKKEVRVVVEYMNMKGLTAEKKHEVSR